MMIHIDNFNNKIDLSKVTNEEIIDLAQTAYDFYQMYKDKWEIANNECIKRNLEIDY